MNGVSATAALLVSELGDDPSRGPFQPIARRFAAAAGLAADPMMLVMRRVSLALRRAYAARFNACSDLGQQEIDISLGLPRDDLRRRRADGAAVGTESNRLHQLGEIRFAEGDVGARRTRLDALGARLDAVDEQRLIEGKLLPGMQLEHPANETLDALRCGHGYPSSAEKE